jgi:uncharacterized Zn-finger protein
MGLDSSPSRLPLFFNKLGVSSIEIGVTACHCMGALPPHDHPHVYLNISEQNDILRDVPRFLACEAGQAIVERSCDLRQ